MLLAPPKQGYFYALNFKSDTLYTFSLLGTAQKAHLTRAEKRANKPRYTKEKNMPNKDDQAKQSQEEPQENNDSQNEQGETGAEGNNGQDPKEPEGNGTGQDGNVEDKHGQPGINREKYQRDIQERDDRIKELEEQVAEAIKTEEGRKELQEKIDELRQTIADDRVNFDLERAGCLNTKAARALLDDYEGDVDQLKEACPYLFQEEKRQTGSTGAKPQGAPDTKVDDTLDRIFGTEKKG